MPNATGDLALEGCHRHHVAMNEVTSMETSTSIWSLKGYDYDSMCLCATSLQGEEEMMQCSAGDDDSVQYVMDGDDRVRVRPTWLSLPQNHFKSASSSSSLRTSQLRACEGVRVRGSEGAKVPSRNNQIFHQACHATESLPSWEKRSSGTACSGIPPS